MSNESKMFYSGMIFIALLLSIGGKVDPLWATSTIWIPLSIWALLMLAFWGTILAHLFIQAKKIKKSEDSPDERGVAGYNIGTKTKVKENPE